MFHTILVPTDGSELADKAISAATQFAAANKGKIVGLSVVEPYPFSPLAETVFLPDQAQFEKQMNEIAQASVRNVTAAADKAGVPCEVVIASGTDPAAEIVQAARDYGCDVIFMASHGRRGLDKLLLGSVTQKVLVLSTIPVLVFR